MALVTRAEGVETAKNISWSEPVYPQAMKPKRHLPKWEEIPMERSLRLFPVRSFGGHLYVSLYDNEGKDFQFSRPTDIKLKDAYYAKPQGGPKEIEGPIVSAALKEAKISADETLFWFLFHAPKEEKRAIASVKSLVIHPDGASEETMWGTFGIEVGRSAATKEGDELVGLAYIGKESLLRPSAAVAPEWKNTKLNVPTEKVLAQMNEWQPLQASSKREVSKPLAVRGISIGPLEVIEGKAEFKVRASKEQSVDQVFGYLLREAGDTKAIIDFQWVDGSNGQLPERVLAGNWVKGYDGSLYVSSANSGQCGIFLLVKDGGKSVRVPVRCGHWVISRGC